MASGAVDAAAEGVAALGISAGNGGQWAELLRRNLRLLSQEQVTNSAATPSAAALVPSSPTTAASSRYAVLGSTLRHPVRSKFGPFVLLFGYFTPWSTLTPCNRKNFCASLRNTTAVLVNSGELAHFLINNLTLPRPTTSARRGLVPSRGGDGDCFAWPTLTCCKVNSGASSKCEFYPHCASPCSNLNIDSLRIHYTLWFMRIFFDLSVLVHFSSKQCTLKLVAWWL
jgi:hypothetical protein